MAKRGANGAAKSKQQSKKPKHEQTPEASIQNASSAGSVGDDVVISPSKDRRDHYDKAERAIERKLGGIYSKQMLDNAVDENGTSLVDYVVAELRRLSGTNCKLPPRFWKPIPDQFKLVKRSAASLPDPARTEPDCRPEVDENLAWVESDNPASRKIEPIVKFLEFCDRKLTYRELHRIITKTMESPTVTHQFMVRAYMAVLKYVVRMKVADEFRTILEVMSEYFDTAITETYERGFSKTKTMQKRFLKSHQKVLELLVDPNQLKTVTEAFIADCTADPVALDRVRSISKCMKSIFSSMSTKSDFERFEADVKQALDELEHADFMPDDTENFKGMCTGRVRELTQDGHLAFEKRPDYAVLFLTAMVKSDQILTINDMWYRQFRARLKTAALNGGLVPWMPWEEWSFRGLGSIANAPRSCKIPPEMLEDVVDVREQILEHLREARCVDLKDMKRIVGRHLIELAELDSSIYLEYAYLVHHADAGVQANHRTQILEVLPSESKPVPYSQVIKELGRMRTFQAAVALPTIAKDITDVLNMVQGMSDDGVGPKAEEIIGFSSVHKQVVLSLANFCTWPENTYVMVDGRLRPGACVGKLAVDTIYQAKHRAVDGGALHSVADFQTLRTFEWVLTPAQRGQLDAWIAKALKDQKARRLMLVDGQPSPSPSVQPTAASAADGGGNDEDEESEMSELADDLLDAPQPAAALSIEVKDPAAAPSTRGAPQAKPQNTSRGRKPVMASVSKVDMTKFFKGKRK